MSREKLLVSACLLGVNCKYDGGNNRNDAVIALGDKFDLIPVCPEQLGGLPTPRASSELKDGGVFQITGTDVTENYDRGAHEAYKIAQMTGCRRAVLKERSPSCGCGKIYDGTFSHVLTDRDGVTAALFRSAGIKIFGETQISVLEDDDEK